ncbi:MAG: hypothetical protein JWQ38_2173 [Flavipsychrobacter sp.]|nr:hypothetical protein [Flavipsychrobacter sp.]
MQKNLPHICPSCSSTLMVKSLVCDQCETEVSGKFGLPLLASLTQQEQDFIIDFVKCSGSLKVMAQNLGLSYPTVRNLLDDVITKVTDNQKNQAKFVK